MKNLFVLPIFISFLLPADFFSQEVKVSNVIYELSGREIIIYYDLEGDIEEEYEVIVKLKRESIPLYEIIPQSVKGDVGEGYFIGKKRRRPSKKAVLNNNLTLFLGLCSKK